MVASLVPPALEGGARPLHLPVWSKAVFFVLLALAKQLAEKQVAST